MKAANPTKRQTRPSRSSTASSKTRSETPITTAASSTAQPYAEVRIPFVPPYVPSFKLANGFLEEPSLPTIHAHKSRNGTILSRYTTHDGRITFIVKTETGNDHNIDVGLADIFDHVTPEELERYENLDWEHEEEVERNRPRLGRPRKHPPLSKTLVSKSQHGMKKPRGRPRKNPTHTSGIPHNHDRTFLAVHIPSPVKSGQPSVEVRRRESTTSSTSEGQETAMLVDQVTPSNARRVIGVNLLDEEPTPSKRVHRTSYPMLEATRVSPQSDSEDELVLRPSAQHPRVPARPEKATSTTENSQQDESLFFSAEESLDGRSDGSDKHQRTDRSLDDGQPPPRRPTLFRGGKILRESTERSSVDPIDLLDRFQASKTRRLRLPSTSSASSDKPRSKLIDQYFQPKRSEKRSIVSTKRRQPPASSSNIPNSLPNLHNHKESAKSTSALSSKRAAPPSAPISSKRQQPSATPTNQAQPAPSSKHPATASSSHQRISNVFPTVRSEQSQPQHSAPKATPDRGSTSNPIKKPDATTPKPARNSRKSMTPHFPPSTKKKQKEAKTASPTLRGGSSDSPAALNGTLDMASHRHRRAPSPSLVTDREQIRSLLDSRPAGPFVVDNNDHSIELGSPITASERDTTDELGNPSPPVSRRAMPGIIMLGSPVTPSSSSSSSSSEERRSGPRDAGELRSPCTPSSRGASRKKRRRSVSSSGSGSGSGSAAGGGGRSGYGIPRR